MITSPKLLLLALLAVALVAGSVPVARADEFDEKIRRLQSDNQNNQRRAQEFAAQAVTYEQAIAKLAEEINALQAQIHANEAKHAELQEQIRQAELELARQKSVLGINIKQMYLEGNITTLEMLASSKDLSEFVDKQQYRTSVQEKIKETLLKITALKHQLGEQKTAVERLLAEQQALQVRLDGDRRKQSEMLAYTREQKAQYEQSIKANNAEIAELRRQQIIANSRNTIGGRIGAAHNGYYPYDNWPFSMRDGWGCVDGDGPDRWGYCTRQCVSFAAWAVERSGRRAPMYYGDAKNWVYAGSKYRVSSPQPGDVAITTGGRWGHAMYVEQVSTINGRLAIYVSQYNAALQGEYSEEWRYADGHNFLRFP